MKTLNAKTLAALTLTGALSIGTASAMGLDAGTQVLDSVIGVNSTALSYTVQDGVATLFGNVDSSAEVALAKSFVANVDGVDRVISRVTHH